jgi:beta-mannosidase
LNGEVVAEHDNMFVPLEVNVDTRLLAGTNRLEVRFHSAVRVGAQRRRAYFEREGLPLDLVRFDEGAFVRKAPYMYGWDWGPRLVSVGIWQPVTVVQFAARICDVHVEQEHLPEGDVVVRATAETEGVGHVVHFWRSSGEDAWRRVANGETLRLKRPLLWSPAGSGVPHLHELVSTMLPLGVIELTPEDYPSQRLDYRHSRVGLRTIALEQQPDAWGTSFVVEVNGKPVWCMGANWIPDHSFPSQVTKGRLRKQIERARAMNMNMLRVWGGGIYESDDFYDACDELGILVWQDFPFACSYAPDDTAAVSVAESEAMVAIRRLRNRASLAVWCGNNENLMMFQAKWDAATKHPSRCHGERIWETALPNLLGRMDPHRPYLSTSPQSPVAGQPANSDVCGDQHNWDVWHGRGDWVNYRESRARFASEYGFASAPSPKAWKEALGPSDLKTTDVRAPAVLWHDKTKKGYDTFIAFVELHYARASNVEEWTYFSQLNQRDALCAAIEHYRSSQFCAGSLIWQLNDCWPVQSWSVVDSTGTLKAAGHALRRLYAPALASVNVVEESGRRKAQFVAAYDNGATAFAGDLRVEIRDSSSGECIFETKAHVALQPGERKTTLDVDLTDVEPRRAVLWFEFAGFTAYRLLCEPKELQTSELAWHVTAEGNHLVLESSGPALDVWVLPEGCDATENFLSLPVAGTLRIGITGPCSAVELRWLGGSTRLVLSA